MKNISSCFVRQHGSTTALAVLLDNHCSVSFDWTLTTSAAVLVRNLAKQQLG
jgi:hypothetical protein